MRTGEIEWAYASSKREPDPTARLPWSDAILDDLREFFLAAVDAPWPAIVLRRIQVDGLPHDLLEAVCSICGELHRFIDYDYQEFEAAMCRSPILHRDREPRMPRLMPCPGMDQLPKWERGEMEIRLTIGLAATDLGELAARMRQINAERFGRRFQTENPEETPQ
jgi:hypothetical protein